MQNVIYSNLIISKRWDEGFVRLVLSFCENDVSRLVWKYVMCFDVYSMCLVSFYSCGQLWVLTGSSLQGLHLFIQLLL